ncbi:NAD(P)H-dependent oxidoreductase subunit E [Acetobacterium paludosum]|uniref:NAD(P)H-dependent oxidoreductase subunit E n=2 Tax=Acetobacterium TaxID=33951 RepID=A0A923HWN3_9FIRM|nr:MULTISPECIES: NAD(P)H-dependent oxidoreductase subunit E [Acetobacterium]MBC3797229.1 NAD(P)H-dependent oxidoreductase subunit E [Acetobacterium tundrae]MBC3887321.1 NAD(P)H-dependent oxidoreductase subunit E [Acetobacterium paludosum]
MAELIPVENLDVVKAIVAEHKEVPGCLMQILQDTQTKYGYLPIELQSTIADELDIPLTEVYGVATFYSQFTLKPKGKYKISVCLGTACYVRGSQGVMDKVNNILGTIVGETTEDGKYSVDATRCVGACGLAPVMMVNEEVFGRMTINEVPAVLEKFN